ncbi:MAG: DeoR/GlpR transcriptional regulator [Hyphomicrobiales bacterium]|nr:DeoR/GlpR transcriptional regulator [Hyphomicrobiales bacterium]
MGVRELCDYLQVSDATVRRDLTSLDRRGLLSRTHGGVVANSLVSHDLPDSARLYLNEDEKRRVGEAAIDLLEGDETVLIDAGTTALPIAMNARRKPNCTYVTTSLGISQILKDQGMAKHYLVGGSYLPINDSYCGSLAVAAIRSLSFDIALLCATAIDLQRRAISLGSEAYAQVQREIVSVSRKNIVVADHSKFRASAFAQTVSFDNLDAILTVREVDDGVKAAFAREQLELRLA